MELVIVMAVVVVLSSVAILRFSGSASPSVDVSAKASLVTFQELQFSHSRSSRVPLSASAISSGEYDRGVVTFADDASTAAEMVGVTVTGSLVVGVAASGYDCWALRMDLSPSPASPPLWWFIAENVESCTTDIFANPDFPTDGSGQSPNTPSIIDPA
jgi:hypothetical protein